MAVAKPRSIFVCQGCGATFPKWMGKCTQCGAWNTIEEQVAERQRGAAGYGGSRGPAGEALAPVALATVSRERHSRQSSGISELDRVLGGGVMPGSVILIGGEPGIGKSTLLLQLILKNRHWRSLYVAGEESEGQIKSRADRIGQVHDNILITTDIIVEDICDYLRADRPDIVIVDSIQTIQSRALDSIPGTISQIREAAYQLINVAKALGVPTVLVGHITKVGNIAGPKILEHMVDTVLQFEGESSSGLRVLRTTKNRFGNTSEIGVFEMSQEGLREIPVPSDILVTMHTEPLPGIALALVNEGVRPLVVEVQALVSATSAGMPQRSATGYDIRRVNMLLAVLEKRAGLKLGSRDVFVNITGGIKITDTAADMAIAAAIISSYLDIAVDPGVCFAGEIGLSGEIRPARQGAQRVSEAHRLGFRVVAMPVREKSVPPGVANVDEIKALGRLLARKAAGE